MKSKRSFTCSLLPSAGARAAFLLASTLLAVCTTASAQIYAVNVSGSTVGVYNFNGTTVNATLITSGINQPYSLEIFGSDLFVSSKSGPLSEYGLDGTLVSSDLLNGNITWDVAVSGGNLYATAYGSTVAEYSASTGIAINTSLITGLSNDTGITVSGNYIYVASGTTGVIGKYNLDGTTVDANFITGLNSPSGIKVSGNDLFVLNQTGSVGEYDATTGIAINASLIAGLTNPTNFALSGTNLYISNFTGPAVSEWSTSGALENATLFTLPSYGPEYGYGIAATPQPTPEPATWGLLAGGATLLLAGWRKRARKRA
jgi:hypothetical protein